MKKQIKIKSSLVKSQNEILGKIKLELLSFNNRKKLNLDYLTNSICNAETLDQFQTIKNCILKEKATQFTHGYVLPFAQNAESIDAIKSQINELLKSTNGRAAAHTFTNTHWFFDAVLEMQKTGEKIKTIISGESLPKNYFKKCNSVKRNRAIIEKIGSNYVLTKFEIFDSRS